MGQKRVDDRTPLLKFTKRCGMYPQVETLGRELAAESLEALESFCLAMKHVAHLGRPEAGKVCGSTIKIYAGIVDDVHSAGCMRSIPTRMRRMVSSLPMSSVISNM